MMSPPTTLTPPSLLRIDKSGAASRGVRVGSLRVPVRGSSVGTVVKPVPDTKPWLEMLFTPAGMGGLWIRARNTMVRRLSAGSEPIVTFTTSSGTAGPVEGDDAAAACNWLVAEAFRIEATGCATLLTCGA